MCTCRHNGQQQRFLGVAVALQAKLKKLQEPPTSAVAGAVGIAL